MVFTDKIESWTELFGLIELRFIKTIPKSLKIGLKKHLKRRYFYKNIKLQRSWLCLINMRIHFNYLTIYKRKIKLKISRLINILISCLN